MQFDSSKRVVLLIVLNCLALLATAGFGPPRLVDRETAATIRLTPGELREWYRAAQPPSVSADALLVYDVDAERVLYSRNAGAPLPPASLTKLMTALLTLESGRLADQVHISADDLTDGATMGLVEGEVVSVEDLLWGLLVASGNDAAMALARHLGGDVAAFVQAMNARAEQLGLAETHFMNPNGFDADGHVSSARDVLSLTLRLLEYPLFQEIVGTAEAEIAGHSLTNTNEMLGLFQGVDGVKTGTTAAAGQCLVLSVTQDGRRLLIVVLGSDDRYADVRELNALYRANYEWVESDIDELSVLNRLYGGDGRHIPLRESGEPVAVLQHRWGDPELSGYRDVAVEETTGLERGQSIGTVKWRAGDDLLAENELAVR